MADEEQRRLHSLDLSDYDPRTITVNKRLNASNARNGKRANTWGSIDGDDNANGNASGNNIPSNGHEIYPSRNFWSIGGSIDEALFALPPKQQADVLVDAFFKYIDPSYPIISGALFRSRFEEFWALAPYERELLEHAGGLVEVVASLPPKAEAKALIERFFDAVGPIYPIVPSQVALQFAVYANAVYDTSLQEGLEGQLNTATFYLSCCHQSLCISNYFDRCSLLTIQTLILVCHFLISSDRVADAWSISGIVQRQLYALKLNRNPEGLTMDGEDFANDDMSQAAIGTMPTSHGKNNSERAVADDARLMVGKSDFDRYINLLGRAQGLADFRVIQPERLTNLKALQAIMTDTYQ
ncbi:hypothetical protein MBLNU13_g08030t2 [Cladosporium sp. NU13]